MSRSDEVLARKMPVGPMPFEAFQAQSDWLLEQFDKLNVIRRSFKTERDGEWETIRVERGTENGSNIVRNMIQLIDENVDHGQPMTVCFHDSAREHDLEIVRTRPRPSSIFSQPIRIPWPPDTLLSYRAEPVAPTTEIEIVTFQPEYHPLRNVVTYKARILNTEISQSFTRERLDTEGIAYVMQTLSSLVRDAARRQRRYNLGS